MPVNSSPSKPKQLRALLDTSKLDFILEAHDGLSARIAEEAGFPALWASGLAISASMGVRDSNEASWTQVLEVAEFMADATRVPILLDGDTGFGNFNNFRRLVRKLGERGIAGVCIEDKIFPKTNSFLRGETQPLASVDEFCGKLKAGKDEQADSDFVLVARTEALIAGWGLAEALRRADAYREAGADAIVIHSARSKPDEILAFLDEWANRHPIILIPTKYYTTPVAVFARHKVAVVIWANHLVRSATTAMQKTAAHIAREKSVVGIEDSIATVDEIFRLQGDRELQAAEARYLATAPRNHAIILAATRGSGALQSLTTQLPKTLLRVSGVSLLDRLCDQLIALNVRDLAVVAGYGKEAITRGGLRRFDNANWETTGEVSSLATAGDMIAGPGLVVFGDLLCRRHILQALLEDGADLVIAVDRNIRANEKPARERDLVKLSAPPGHDFLDGENTIASAAFSADFARFDAEWIGALRYSPRGGTLLKDWLKAAGQRPDFSSLSILDFLSAMVASGEAVKAHLVSGGWTTIESAVDLAEASNV